MPPLQAVPIDVQWMVVNANSGTFYAGFPAALTAAVALSVANANAPVYIAIVDSETVQPGGNVPAPYGLASTFLDAVGGGTPAYVVGLVSSTTTYYPKQTAYTQGLASSVANSNVPYAIARCLVTVTAP